MQYKLSKPISLAKNRLLGKKNGIKQRKLFKIRLHKFVLKEISVIAQNCFNQSKNHALESQPMKNLTK